LPKSFEKTLVVGVSSTALFDLREEDKIFKEKGVQAYCDRQLELEKQPLKPGAAFSLVQKLLNIHNRLPREGACEIEGIEVILMSKNSPDSSLRIFHSIQEHQLGITRAALTGGKPLTPYIKAFNVDLFLSTDEDDVKTVTEGENGIAAALVYSEHTYPTDSRELNQLKIAFDGDAVIFSEESERIYKEKGLEYFLEYEKENADNPMQRGPFYKLACSLAHIQKELKDEKVLRTALITARNAPAHERVLKTLRTWGLMLDEAYFLGGIEKSPVVKAFAPDFFFDDQEVHLEKTVAHTPGGKVPSSSP
jgi:5'-nucleotidase